MSEISADLNRTLDRIVEDHVTIALREAADERGNGAAVARDDATSGLWAALEEAGFAAIGGGGDEDVAFADAMAVVRRAGYHALPVPLAETVIARRLLAQVGIPAPAGAITLAPPGAGGLGVAVGDKLSGTARSVPYGRSVAHAVVATSEAVHLIDAREALTARGANMAGEARDTIDLAKCRVVASRPATSAAMDLEAGGALVRAVQISGALAAALDHSLTWVNDRIQFGKPIGKHQAVQHLMAQLAEEAAAAASAADLGVEASERGLSHLHVAIAKARAGEAAGKAANIAHATFGAMGFTREHVLHYSTRRLWAWRNEFGSEVYWQAEIGRRVAAAGGRGLWPLLADR